MFYASQEKKHGIFFKTAGEINDLYFLCELKISPQYNSLLSEIVRAYRFLSEWEYDFSPFNLLFLS